MSNNAHAAGVLRDGISLFFPAYNEESNVGAVIEKATEVLAPLNCNYEIIIVDDGSKDNTAKIVKSHATRHKNVVLKRHEKNQGYGAALQTGFRSATLGLVFFSDCDRQFDLGELSTFLEMMNQDPEIDAVVGYRIKRADPWFRRLNAFGWKLWSRVMFGLKVRDVDCAFKLFKREMLKNIVIESTGALINIEILSKLKNMGAKIVEKGVRHYPRTAGSQTGAKLKVILKAFYESFKLYGKIRRFKKGLK
ncbi:MAG: glycosyltransferase family 2 protein [Bacillota bacterium]